MRDMTYPSIKPISGINAATDRTSGVRIIHSTSLTAIPDRMDTTMLKMIRMLSPACQEKWKHVGSLSHYSGSHAFSNSKMSVVKDYVSGLSLFSRLVSSLVCSD